MVTTEQDFDVFQVFTPTTQARLNFVPRLGLEDSLVRALRTPGKQVVVYGETGSGKSTLLLNKLEQLYAAHITTSCNLSTTFDQLLLDAFDQLDPYYVIDRTDAKASRRGGSLGAEYLRIRASLDAFREERRERRETRFLPPQLTIQRLGEFLGVNNLCWVLEDFHKVPANEKQELSESLKTLSDLAVTYPMVKVVAIGAVDTARQVVEYDREMNNRVAEVMVPLMTTDEIGAIVDNGSRLMNVDMHVIKHQITTYSVGVASVCHQLALNAWVNNDIYVPAIGRHVFGEAELEAALNRWVHESSDTLKGVFERALKRHKVRRFDNCRLILQTLAHGPLEGMLHADILREIRTHEPEYPPGNLTKYLRDLETEDRGSVIQVSGDGRHRFVTPLHHTFAQVTLLPARRPVRQDFIVLFEQIRALVGEENVRFEFDVPGRGRSAS
jgi:hypothetical protein